jgi:hypothetical protein
MAKSDAFEIMTDDLIPIKILSVWPLRLAKQTAPNKASVQRMRENLASSFFCSQAESTHGHNVRQRKTFDNACKKVVFFFIV